MSYEIATNQNTRRQDSLIPNTQIESMFLRISSDDEMGQYTRLVEAGHISLETAYASNKVYKLFYLLVDEFEKQGENIEDLKNKK